MEKYDNILPEITIQGNRPKHSFNSCVYGIRYISDLLLGKSGATENLYNVKGNAWDLANSSYGLVFDANLVLDYKVGDFIVFNRPAFASDSKKNIPDQNQHVGVITGFNKEGMPMVTHYTKSKTPSYFKYEPINNVTFDLNIKYTPNKVIRLNKDSDLNFTEKNISSIPNNDNYGKNLKAAITKINTINKPEFNLTSNEEINLKLATLGIINLESNFGGSPRYTVRATFPELLNTAKQIYRKKPEIPSVGYGSIKPEFVYLNTTYSDLDEKLKNKEITKKDYYNLASLRTATLRNKTSTFGVLPSLGYNLYFDKKYNPSTSPSYIASMLHWGGIDTRKVGESIESDVELVYGLLVGLHKKYPNKTIEELVNLYKGSKLNNEDKEKFNTFVEQALSGNINLPVTNKLLLSYNKILDKAKKVKRNLKIRVAKNIIPGVHLKAAVTDFLLDDKNIDNSFLSSEEYSALVDVVKQAIANNKKFLGYTSDDRYQAYTPEGLELSGKYGGNVINSVIKNMSDPYTKLLNFLGLTKITEDQNNYYIIDEYDFNNYGKTQNAYQGFVRNPTPYNAIRSIGTTKGSAPGVGRKVKIIIPKKDLK